VAHNVQSFGRGEEAGGSLQVASVTVFLWVTEHAGAAADTARRPAATHRPPTEPTLPLTSGSNYTVSCSLVSSVKTMSTRKNK